MSEKIKGQTRKREVWIVVDHGSGYPDDVNVFTEEKGLEKYLNKHIGKRSLDLGITRVVKVETHAPTTLKFIEQQLVSKITSV